MSVESLQQPTYVREPQPIRWTRSCLKKLNLDVSTFDYICQFLGEFIGTAMLVFLGCMGGSYDDSLEHSVFQSAFTIGLVVMVISHCFGCICGAHLNPAITLAVYIYDMISLTMAGVYILGQLLGAFLGYALMIALIPDSAVKLGGAAHGVCVATPHPDITTMQGFWIEFVLTAMLIFTTCSAADSRNITFQDSLSIRFGLTVTCLTLAGGQYTGALTNPFKAVASSVWTSDYQDQWVFWAAPMLSSAVSATFYKVIFKRDMVERELNEKR
ncbi:aquaporin AQPAn.G [Bactrocera oleae]|uniref:aquaporin AQPAn.G n=1 Tax=Bactrocera oleae TaxID=104688 RepID=UPI0006B86EE5|nr:aquaporin AQPAn.G isoform X2 [Bactrocera oleae]